MAQGQFDRIAELLHLNSNVRDFLRHPMREHHVRIPVRLDDNSVRVFWGYRIQHNDSRGPCKGGVRFHPQETLSTLRALAMGMTWKAALLDIPLGGSSGGVICDPHNLSRGEEERLCRGWVRQLVKNIGPTVDVISPDIMVGSQQLLWMLDEYEQLVGRKQPGVSTGKAGFMSAAFPRVQSTGVGVALVVRETLKHLVIRPADARASVQGFGMVARHAIRTLIEMGVTITSVASWCPEDGLWRRGVPKTVAPTHIASATVCRSRNWPM
jgi:glutamate dehydrogenase (NAD(P)+)